MNKNVMTKNWAIFGLSLLFSSSAVAQTPPANTSQSATIHTHGDGPFFQLSLPQNIYPKSSFADLRELRIRNANGEFVSYAWKQTDPIPPQWDSRDVPIFPITDPTPSASEISAQLNQNSDGSLSAKIALKAKDEKTQPQQIQSWIIDTSQIKGQLLQAHFTIPNEANAMFPYTLEQSDDLLHWRTIATHQQLIQLKYQDKLIQNLELGLNQISTRYLRLRWDDPKQNVLIEKVIIVSQALSNRPPLLEWSARIKAKSCTLLFCDYALPPHTPIDALRISLNENNTLAQVTIQGLNSHVKDYHRLHDRNPLFLLRHQRQAITAPNMQEAWIQESTVFRLSLANGEAISPDLAMDGNVYEALRLRHYQSIANLGQTPPEIQIASIPRQLVFLAHGAAPYTLEWGNAQSSYTKQGAPIALSILIPQRFLADVIKEDTAEVQIPINTNTTANPQALPTPPKAPRWWLWASLGLALILLSAMIVSLFRTMRAKTLD